MIADEITHQLNTRGVLDDRQLYAILPEQIFGALEIHVLADDNARNFVEQRRTSTHYARTECADQDQLRPVSPSACIANADDLGMSRRISGLHSQVVPSRHNASILVG